MPQDGNTRFYRYSSYLRMRHRARTFRVSVDAGFSCPNRTAGRESPGCIYCDAAGSRAPYLDTERDMERQIRGGVEFLSKRYRAEAFALYFQAYSGTNASVDRLARMYDHALSVHRFVELIVATRADCIDEDRADLLSSYITPTRDVWVELGLQSVHDSTLLAIARGHNVAQFERAYRLLKERGLRVGVHLLFGLPGEGIADVYQAADYVARLCPDGVKAHNLRIIEGSPLYTMALRGEVPILGSQRYLSYLQAFLPRIPADTVILRLGFDPPRRRKLIPSRFIGKSELYATVDRRLAELGLRQGSLCGAQARPTPPPQRL